MSSVPPFDTNLPTDEELISLYPQWIRTLEDRINQLISQYAIPGTIIVGFFNPIPAGWLHVHTNATVGKTGANATYANDLYFNLFQALWGGANINSAIMYSSGGGRVDTRVDVNADWNAGNIITIPTLHGRSLRVASDSNPTNAGIYEGVDSTTLSGANLPSFYMKTPLPQKRDLRISVDDVHAWVGEMDLVTYFLTDGQVYYRDGAGNEAIAANAPFDNRPAQTTLTALIKY